MNLEDIWSESGAILHQISQLSDNKYIEVRYDAGDNW